MFSMLAYHKINFAFLLGLLFLLTQTEGKQIVYLKNGSIIKCNILEEELGQSLKIQTSDGNTFVYKMDLVEKIISEEVLAQPLVEANQKKRPTQSQQIEPKQNINSSVSAVTPTNPIQKSKADNRSSFSVTRFFLESLAGDIVGGLAAWGTYSATCGGGDCFGAGMLGLGAEFIVSPLAVYSVGNLMGGKGSLSATYYGGIVASAPFSASASSSPDATPSEIMSNLQLELTIASIILPLANAGFYELTSHLFSKNNSQKLAALKLNPIYGRDGINGAALIISKRF